MYVCPTDYSYWLNDTQVRNMYIYVYSIYFRMLPQRSELYACV